VLRRMQRVRHLGGAERTEVLRNPVSVFDGVADDVDIQLEGFGPRVKGVGDFPFIVRPYLQRSVTGIFGATDAASPDRPKGVRAGLLCTYVDGHEEKVAFGSREELLDFKTRVENAWRSGEGQVGFRGKSILLDEPLVYSVKELIAHGQRNRPAQSEDRL